MGAPVRAMVRTLDKASSVERKGVEAVVADFGAPETLDAALEGVERAFLVTLPDPRASGISSSSPCSGLTRRPRRVGRVHAGSERYLEGSGLAYTVLRPIGFLQNTLAYTPSIASESRFYASLAEAKVARVNAHDIAAVVAKALT
ncbi:MAG: hypothetical protein M3122_03325 [Actinomycetota bacterium]|nr:hypothetical protein [Actinomycetota bacterium]